MNRSLGNARKLRSSSPDEQICRKCKKHDDSVSEEIHSKTVNWVNCENCEQWYHQSCARINPPQVQIAQFFCRSCRRFWMRYHQEKMEAYIEKTFGGTTEKLILSEWIDGLKKEPGFPFTKETIRKYMESYLRLFVHDNSKNALKRIQYAFVGRIRCSIEAITEFEAHGKVITSIDKEILAFFLNDSDTPLFSSDGRRKRKTRSRRGLLAATTPSPDHNQQIQSLSPTNQILANANDTIVNHNVKKSSSSSDSLPLLRNLITDATPDALVGPPIDSRLSEIVIPDSSLANMQSSPASDPKPSLLMNKVAPVESKCSSSERLEGSCSAKETTETVSSFSEKPQAPVRKNPIPEDVPIDQMLMTLVQVLETSEANTQIPDATPDALVGPSIDSGLSEIVIPDSSLANVPSSPAPDPIPSLPVSNVAIADLRHSPIDSVANAVGTQSHGGKARSDRNQIRSHSVGSDASTPHSIENILGTPFQRVNDNDEVRSVTGTLPNISAIKMEDDEVNSNCIEATHDVGANGPEMQRPIKRELESIKQEYGPPQPKKAKNSSPPTTTVAIFLRSIGGFLKHLNYENPALDNFIKFMDSKIENNPKLQIQLQYSSMLNSLKAIFNSVVNNADTTEVGGHDTDDEITVVSDGKYLVALEDFLSGFEKFVTLYDRLTGFKELIGEVNEALEVCRKDKAQGREKYLEAMELPGHIGIYHEHGLIKEYDKERRRRAEDDH